MVRSGVGCCASIEELDEGQTEKVECSLQTAQT